MNAVQPATTPPARQLRKACDECHGIKVRCVPVEAVDTADPSARGTCQRCARLALVCHFSPPDVVVRRRKRKSNDAFQDSDEAAAASSSSFKAPKRPSAPSRSSTDALATSVSSPPFGPTSSAAATGGQQPFTPSLNLPPFSNGTALSNPGDPASSMTVDWNSLFAAFPTPLADPTSWQEAANHDTCTHSHGVDPFSFDPQLAFALPHLSAATPLSLHADPKEAAARTFQSLANTGDVIASGFPTNMRGDGTLASRSSLAGSSASPSAGCTQSTPCLSTSTVTTPATSLLSGRDAARLMLSKLSSQFSAIQQQLYPGPFSHSDHDDPPLPHAVPKLASVAETIATVSELLKYECEDFGDDFEGAEVHDPSRTEPAAAAQWKRFLSPHAAFLGFSAVMQLYTCLSAYLSAPLDHATLLEELRPVAPALLDSEKETVRKILVASHLRGLDKIVERWDEMARQRHHDDGCVCVVQTMVTSFRSMSDALKGRHGV